MLSRIAEHLFWLGRHLERAENSARLVESCASAVIELRGGGYLENWPLLALLGDDAELNNRLMWSTWADDNPSSLKNSLIKARENARVSRDHLSEELWETLNSAYFELRNQSASQPDEIWSLTRLARERAQLWFGIAHSTLPRGPALWFIRLGQSHERLDQVLRVLLAGVAPLPQGTSPAVADHLERTLLRSLSGYEPYRRIRHHDLSPRSVHRFLLYEASFPRSARASAADQKEMLERLCQTFAAASKESLEAANALLSQVEWSNSATSDLESQESLLQTRTEVLNLAQKLEQGFFYRTPFEALQIQEE